MRNLFTIVHALIGVSERSARDFDDPKAAFGILRERTGALATASTIGTADANSDLVSVDPSALSREVLAPYGNRVAVEGDVPLVPDTWAMPIALVQHELATNAVTHGPLSSAGGTAALKEQPRPTRLSPSGRSRVTHPSRGSWKAAASARA